MGQHRNKPLEMPTETLEQKRKRQAEESPEPNALRTRSTVTWDPSLTRTGKPIDWRRKK